MTELKWYARAVVASACALVVSGMWLFFNISGLIFSGATMTRGILLVVSVASTYGLVMLTMYADQKATWKEGLLDGLEPLSKLDD